jgi:exosortase/archaeosortase family protein
MYVGFFAEYLNIVKALTVVLTDGSEFVIKNMGYNVVVKNYHSLRISGSPGVRVNPSCLGWFVMSFWTAFVFANLGVGKFKLKWTVIGVAAILLLNICRISLIVLANHHKWAVIRSLDHHQTFNIASYCCILILIGFYVKAQRRYENNYARTEAVHEFSSV